MRATNMRLHAYGDDYIFFKNNKHVFLKKNQVTILKCFLQKHSVTDTAKYFINLFKCDEKQKNIISANISSVLQNIQSSTNIDLDKEDKLDLTGDLGKFYPRIISIELSNNCNFFCGHCYKSACQKNKQFFSLSLINELCELFSGKVQLIHLTGGEPLLHSDINTIIYKLADSGFLINITTNGSAYKRLTKKALSLINNFQISLYGYDVASYLETTNIDVFFAVDNFFQFLKEQKKKFDIGLLLNRQYLQHYNEFNNYINHVSPQRCIVGFAGLAGRLLADRYAHKLWYLNKDERLKALLLAKDIESNTINSRTKQVHTCDCQAASLSYSVNEYGVVHVCQLLTDPHFAIGNLIELNKRCQSRPTLAPLLKNRLSYLPQLCKYSHGGQNVKF